LKNGPDFELRTNFFVVTARFMTMSIFALFFNDLRY